MEDILQQVIEAWRTNNRIHLYLIERIDDEAMKHTLSKRGGRNVVRQFTHIHNVRYWQLEKRASDLVKGLHKFATYDEPDRANLIDSLNASAAAIETFLTRCITGEGKHRSFKRGMITTLSYFISHESHHRGNILLTLKQHGYKVGKDAQYAIWDWDRR